MRLPWWFSFSPPAQRTSTYLFVAFLDDWQGLLSGNVAEADRGTEIALRSITITLTFRDSPDQTLELSLPPPRHLDRPPLPRPPPPHELPAAGPARLIIGSHPTDSR